LELCFRCAKAPPPDTPDTGHPGRSRYRVTIWGSCTYNLYIYIYILYIYIYIIYNIYYMYLY
jgi:hypothetical protein